MKMLITMYIQLLRSYIMLTSSALITIVVLETLLDGMDLMHGTKSNKLCN